MSIALDHITVPAQDRRDAARRLAAILGVAWARESGVGPFSAVYVAGDLTIDFDETPPPFPVSHLCFRLDDPAFDALLARLHELGVPFRSLPHGPVDRQVNTAHGGRIVYWSEPDGHVWEALTVSYARPVGA